MRSLLASLGETISGVVPSDRREFLTVEVLVPDKYREKLRLEHFFPEGSGDLRTRVEIFIKSMKSCDTLSVELDGGALHASIKDKVFTRGFVANYNVKTRTGTLKLSV